MCDFLHPIVMQQVSAKQPKLWILIVCLVVPNWLPTITSFVLMQCPSFSHFMTPHDAAYRVSFFVLQLSLTIGCVVLLSAAYSSAIWVPQPSWQRTALKSLLMLLPIFLFYLSGSIIGTQSAFALSGFGVEGNKMLDSIHNQVWGQLAYGPSLPGVLCVSVMAFVEPVLEEMIFRGFVINALVTRIGFVGAIIGASACFALLHVIQFGVGVHLIPLFFAGATYGIIRVYSGSLAFAVVGHLAVNTVIFLPKWAVALLHFAHG